MSTISETSCWGLKWYCDKFFTYFWQKKCKTLDWVIFIDPFPVIMDFHLKNIHTVKFWKYTPPCTSPSKYWPPKLVTQKNPLLNRPSRHKPQVLVIGSCSQIQCKAKQKWYSYTFFFLIAQLILWCKFRTVYKPFRKGLWKI